MINLELIEQNFDDYRIGQYNNKTYVAVLLAYEHEGFNHKQGYGLISRYSWGKDYHIVMKERIESVFGSDATYYVDSKEINEREVAMHLGLGIIGKNNLLLNEKYGSFFFIGVVEVESTSTSHNENNYNPCKSCNKCEIACPASALSNYKLDEEKCLSSITQKKIPYTMEQVKSISSNIFGCDICQLVCPTNKGVDKNVVEDFKPNNTYIDLEEIFTLTNKEFQDKYKNKACTWRGKLVMMRNACCVAYNQKLEHIKPIMIESLKTNDIEWYKETVNLILENWK